MYGTPETQRLQRHIGQTVLLEPSQRQSAGRINGVKWPIISLTRRLRSDAGEAASHVWWGWQHCSARRLSNLIAYSAEAVEDGIGQRRLPDDVVPVLDRNLTGDDGRRAAVADANSRAWRRTGTP